MKKQISIFMVAFLSLMSFGASAQVTPIAFSEVDGIQTLTPWSVKFNTSHTGQYLEVNDLIAVAVGKAILPSGDTIVSADSLSFQATTLGQPHVMQIFTNTENTTINFFVETKIVDTIGGGYVVIDTHISESLPATTVFLNGVPDSWNESFKDTTSGGVTLMFDADGQNGSWFSVVQESGPGSIVSQSVYVEGQQDSVEIQITNCQPNSQYTIRVYGDAGNNVALHTSGFLTFTTDPITGPLVYLSPEDSSSSHLEVEYTVIGNGSNTPYTLSFDGNVVLTGSTSDTVTGTLPSSGLNFSTPYTWSLSASNPGGSAVVDLIMSTTGLNPLSLGGVDHELIGQLELDAYLTIPTYSDGGPSDVIVHHPASGMSYIPTPGQVSAGNDTTYVTIPLLTPGEPEEVIIQLNRIPDGEMETWSYYINMWEPGEVSISTVQPNQPVSNSHSVVIDVDRSVDVGGVSADLTLELQTQAQPPQWTQVDVQNIYASSGSIQDTVSYQNLIASSVYRLTILGQDSVSPHTDNTEIVTFTTGPVPNDPSVSFVSPIDWDAPDWIAHVQMNFNTMSPTGGTGYLRASNNPSNLYTPLSNADDEALSAGWTQNVMMYIDIEPYIQAGDDTLYYLGYVVNNEGGWSYTQEWSVALPELEPDPEPVGPLEFLGSQPEGVDSLGAIIGAGFDTHGLDSCEALLHVFSLSTSFDQNFGPEPITGMNLNWVLNGILDDTTRYFYEIETYIAGVYDDTYGLFEFTTLASPVPPVDPSGIEELLQKTPNVRGDLVDILGRTIATGVPLIEMERGWYQFNADVVIWTDGKGHSKQYVSRFH